MIDMYFTFGYCANTFTSKLSYAMFPLVPGTKSLLFDGMTTGGSDATIYDIDVATGVYLTFSFVVFTRLLFQTIQAYALNIELLKTVKRADVPLIMLVSVE